MCLYAATAYYLGSVLHAFGTISSSSTSSFSGAEGGDGPTWDSIREELGDIHVGQLP